MEKMSIIQTVKETIEILVERELNSFYTLEDITVEPLLNRFGITDEEEEEFKIKEMFKELEGRIRALGMSRLKGTVKLKAHQLIRSGLFQLVYVSKNSGELVTVPRNTEMTDDYELVGDF